MNIKQVFLAALTHRLKSAGVKFDLGDDSITVHNSESTPTVVRIEKVGVIGMDGKEIPYSVKIAKRCVNPDKDLLDLGNLGRWNVFTSILSAIKDDDGLKVFARLNLYEGSLDVIEHVYAPLTYWAIWLAPGHAAYLEAGQPNAFGFVRGFAPSVDPWWFGIPNDAATEPPSFREEDFNEGVSFARKRGLLSTGGADGLSIDFPWDPGAIGALYEMFKEAGAFENSDVAEKVDSTESGKKRTSLLTIETNQPHPLFGKGTLIRLQVPVTTDPEKIADLVNNMNIWESESGDLPPFFGSWCIDPRFPSPAYVMFVPSMLGRTTTILSLIVWMHSRHRASMGYLKQFGLE